MGLTQWWRRLTGRKDVRGGVKGRQTGQGSRGRSGQGVTALPEHLKGIEQPKGRPGRMPTPDPARGVLGVDATRTGWLGALLDPTGHGTPHLFVAASLPELLEQAGAVAVVAVTVPLGLPDQGRREADVQTRRFLGEQGSSVLTTPVRDAVYAISHGEANTFNRAGGGSGVSSQAWELRRRIQELDAWVRQDLPALVVETHPEAAFATLAGAPLQTRRRSGEGAIDRRALLATGGVYVPTTAPHGVGTDDLLDACAAAWSAHRVKNGEATTFPEDPQRHSDGIAAAIHV
jgi:predicted RNase H-like nuclease